MPQYPVGIGTSSWSGNRNSLRGRLLSETRALGIIAHVRSGQTRPLGFAAQQPYPSQLPSVETGQPQAPPPRPPPPPVERAGDLTNRLLRDYLSGWTSQFTEYDYYVPAEAVYGNIPEDIRGTLFLIGPGLIDAYGTCVRHPSDADGMVCSLAFGSGGQVFFRNRYVRTSSFLAEQAANNRVTRGVHDRGAPFVLGQQQQPAQEPPQHQQRHHHHQQQQQEALPPALQAAAASFMSFMGQGSADSGSSGGFSSASPSTSSSSSGWNGPRVITANRYGGGSSSSSSRAREAAADGGWESDEATRARTGYTAGGIAAGASGASAARHSQPSSSPRGLDPLALLGLPPLPPLSSLFNPLDTAFRAPANASVVYWAGRLLAFSEGGSLPYELNKISLETVGRYDAGGSMSDIGRLVGGYKIAPAPRQGSLPGAIAAPRPHRLVVMGAAQSGLDTLVRWVELGEDGSPAGPATTYRLPGCVAQCVVDFWVTDRYYVVLQAPLDFNPQRFATLATIGAASFAECFDWDSGRPSKLHLVARPNPPPPSASTASARAGAGTRRSSSPSASSRSATTQQATSSGSSSSSGGSKSIVWPAKGPDAIVLDAPPLLPTSCVGSYRLAEDGNVLVLDAICQQGLPGSSGGTLDNLSVQDHRDQPKPELVRLVVDLTARTATARVLVQRTASAATTAAQFTAGNPATATSRTPSATTTLATGVTAPVGHGGSFYGGYHYLFAAASVTDAAAGWAPSQVLLKLALPPEHAVPAASRTVSGTAAVASLAGRRGIGAAVWAPGDRVFVGPPVFVPRQAAAAAAATVADAVTAGEVTRGSGGGGLAVALAAATGGKTISALPPLESEVEASARRAAAAAVVRRQEEEQEGWLLVMVHDAARMVAELCILDARDVASGPVAVVALPHHLPHARAGHFTRTYCGPGLAAPQGWRPRTAATASASDSASAAAGTGISASGSASASQVAAPAFGSEPSATKGR